MEGWIGGFGCITYFHAIVKQRHAVERQHEHLCRKRALQAETYNCPGVLVVV
jgi:hypothetical protein